MSHVTYQDDSPTRKSSVVDNDSINVTEAIAVPSSEHVAEIVGRQGCKIKALRAKTNTYIKTPVRGTQPVFVVTGRQQDVAHARTAILAAADHFSQIRIARECGSGNLASPVTNSGCVTFFKRVPYKVVGLVVGPKGATVKRIQQDTSTYIITPGRDKEPVFEITGTPDNVEKAKLEIDSHIVCRTFAESKIGANMEQDTSDYYTMGRQQSVERERLRFPSIPPTCGSPLYSPMCGNQNCGHGSTCVPVWKDAPSRFAPKHCSPNQYVVASALAALDAPTFCLSPPYVPRMCTSLGPLPTGRDY